MKEPRIHLIDGSRIPFTAADNAQLARIMNGWMGCAPEPGDLPNAVEIGRSIAAHILRERGA